MSEPKTRPTDASVDNFLAAVQPEQRRRDAIEIRALMERATGERAVMWGTSIVGFGAYTDASNAKKPIEWPLTGFSPRKANLTLYITPGIDRFADLTGRLGTFTTGASCLYIKRLDDVDRTTLEDLVREAVLVMRERHAPR